MTHVRQHVPLHRFLLIALLVIGILMSTGMYLCYQQGLTQATDVDILLSLRQESDLAKPIGAE